MSQNYLPQQFSEDLVSAPYQKVHTYHDYPIHIHVFLPGAAGPGDIPRHWHRSIEICYRPMCRGYYYLEGERYELIPDTITLFNSCAVHEMHGEAIPERHSIVVILPYEYLLSVIPDIDHYYFEIDPCDPVLKDLLLRLGETELHPGNYMELHVQALASELLYHLMSRFSRKRTSHLTLPGQAEKWNKEIIRYIYQHYDAIESVEELAGHFGYSREHFSRQFHQNTGMSCQTFLQSIRLEKAVKMMQKGERHWEIIAKKAGFKNARSFENAFKNQYHITPLKYATSILSAHTQK